MSYPTEEIPSLQPLSITTDSDIPQDAYNLSDLGITAAENSESVFNYGVLTNLWHPTQNQNGFVSLAVAENSLMHETLVEYLKSNFELSTTSLTYGDGGMGSLRLRKALAHFLNRRLKPAIPLQIEHLAVTNGCSSAIEHCSYMFTNPNEGILLGQPYYATFMTDIELRPKAKVVKVRFGAIDPVSSDAVQCYENALKQAESSGTKIRALMLCNPHNPLGRCYSRETIVSLMRLCSKHNIHFISDEIYAFSVFENKEDESPPPTKFVSALSINLSSIIEPHLVHVLWGMSKDFGANGIRLGAIITQSNIMLQNALKLVALYSYPSSMVDGTIAKLLEDDAFTDKYIAENQRLLSQRYSLVVAFLRQHRIEYAPGVNAAFFLWLNLGKAYVQAHPEEKEKDLHKIGSALVDEFLDKKVYIAGGDAFGSEEPGWFRLVFPQDEVYLMEGLKRIVAVIQGGINR